jgi:cysteine-rich repeat protein
MSRRLALAGLVALAAAACGGGADSKRPGGKDSTRPGGANISAAFNRCPALTSYTAAPLSTSMGTPIEVSATAEDSDGDPVRFFWFSPVGALDPCLSARATYRCVSPGENRLNIVISDGKCVSLGSFSVTCTAATAQGCGDGVVGAGEGCDDGNLDDGDGCSSSCQPDHPPPGAAAAQGWGACHAEAVKAAP